MKSDKLNLTEIRERLQDAHGQEYWRSLEELAETDEFTEFLQREFPKEASMMTGLNRRSFLKLMGASLAFAGLGLAGCTNQPKEKIYPYVRAPEEIVPGKPLFYATAMPLGGYGQGLLVESHEGRPTKIEGNPDHPASLGSTDAIAQASVLTLYDPERSQVVQNAGLISTWDNFLTAINMQLDETRAEKGKGLRILTETVTSPTLARQLETILTELPEAKWHQYEPVSRDNVRDGSKLAFGEYLETHYRFDKADVILSLDADFLSNGPAHVRYTRNFSSKRRIEGAAAKINRLYVVESTPTNTGTMADHRRPVRAGEIESFAYAVASEILPNMEGSADDWAAAIARDLQNHRGTSIVIAGDNQPPSVHALAHAMNDALGNVGETVIYTESVEANPVNQMASLQELVADIDTGKVEILIIIGGNPVYTAPADLKFADKLDKVNLRIHLNLYDDETSEFCHWYIPQAHYLESWSDVRAYDGTVSIVQPLIEPLYGGRTAHELLAIITENAGRSSHAIVKGYWQEQHGEAEFEKLWQTTLHDGWMKETALPPKQVAFPPSVNLPRIDRTPQSLEIIFQPDPTIWDGRFANNGWLQELPKPLTKLTWDNAALISPSTAEKFKLVNGDVVELRYEGRTVEAPIWMLPGQPTDSITVHLGYGRKRTGRVGIGTGFNAYALRTSDAPWFGDGVKIHRTGKKYELVTTQNHHSMEGRHLVREGTLEEYQKHPDFVHELEHHIEPASMFPEHAYDGYAWGMAIDLNACIGCNACVVACQSENNIPIVGKQQVAVGREMHWIRIDRYYKGGLDSPQTYHQPMACVHCEQAPCEVVCPVAATTHSQEGLNEMTYNRCVGTRYCANNCPYKVRRFNFLQYTDEETESLKLQRNPDVTVRNRGVMEKCTYCVQRINAARIEAKNQDREIRDGEVITACQAVCPAEAIVFGDINDPSSHVSKLKAQGRNYDLLTELNTKPRTSYLAKIRNPNPEMGE